MKIKYLNLKWRITQWLLEKKYGKYSQAIDTEPIHAWFELTYSSYFVMQRTILQSMPIKWQRRFVKLIEEVEEYFPEINNGQFMVKRKDDNNKFISDELSNYERGRRILPRNYFKKHE